MSSDTQLDPAKRLPLGVAIIGCGAVTEFYHGPALKALVGTGLVEVKVLVDPNPERLACVANQFESAKTANEIKADAFLEVDMAIVASPPRWHAENVLRLVGLGIHVLCEKPMARTPLEAKQMVRAAREARCLLSLGLFRRFFASSVFIKDLVDGQSLGVPLEVDWHEGGLFNWPAASPSFFTRNASSGGVFADMGTHVLDLLMWWFGDPDSIEYEDDAMGGLEANAHALITFAGGVRARVRLSRDTDIPNGTRIQFENGSVWIRGASADVVEINPDNSRWGVRGKLHQASQSKLGGVGSDAPGYHSAFVAQIENFVSAVLGEGTLRVQAEEAQKVSEWIDRGYATRRLMKMPWLSVDEATRANLTVKKEES